ncbi:MAG TPA: hypothetical protein VG816_15610 [Solirubrobacterales bacterium]|nr:hypothetical protein [Solirubrobacterales bacterium]
MAAAAGFLLALVVWPAYSSFVPGARAASPARLDPTFGESGRVVLPPGSAAGNVTSALMPDDGLLIGSGRSLLRLTPDGQIDKSFGQWGTSTLPAPAGGDFEIDGLAVDSKGRIVVAGTSFLPEEDFSSAVSFGNGTEDGPEAARVMRYLGDGALDPSFGAGGIVETDLGLPAPRDKTGQQILSKPWVEVSGVAVDSKDRVLLTGGASAGVEFGCFHDWNFNTLTYAAFVARLTETGVLDPSFAGDGVAGGSSVRENPLHTEGSVERGVGPGDELIYESGGTHCWDKAGSSGLVRLGSTGDLSPSFGTDGVVRGMGEVVVRADGAMVSHGFVSPWYFPKEAARIRVDRLRPNGRPNRIFGRGGEVVVKSPGGAGSILGAAVMDARGRVLLGGTMISGNARRRGSSGQEEKQRRRSFVLVRLGARGRIDRAFGPHGRIATGFGALGVAGLHLMLDSQGRAVMVGVYGSKDRGLALARYVIGR